MTDHAEAAEELLDVLFGPSWRVNPKHDDGHALGLIEAALLAAERRGLADALRAAARHYDERWKQGIGDGLNEVGAWLDAEADRIEGEDGE